MVIHDLDIFCPRFRPAKADAPLIVNTDAMLAEPGSPLRGSTAICQAAPSNHSALRQYRVVLGQIVKWGAKRRSARRTASAFCGDGMTQISMSMVARG